MTMKCPACGGQASKKNHEDPFVCTACGWQSDRIVQQFATFFIPLSFVQEWARRTGLI